MTIPVGEMVNVKSKKLQRSKQTTACINTYATDVRQTDVRQKHRLMLLKDHYNKNINRVIYRF